jgi:hypothetical protein
MYQLLSGKPFKSAEEVQSADPKAQIAVVR